MKTNLLKRVTACLMALVLMAGLTLPGLAATHDYNVANQTFPNTRTDINSVLSAILSNNSSAATPGTTAAFMQWADSDDKLLKFRNSGNAADLIKINLDSDMVNAQSSAYTVALTDYGKLITADATGSAFTIDLPSAAAATIGEGFWFTIKKTDSTVKAVTIDGNGTETIDGSTTFLLGQAQEAVTLISDGTNWRIADHNLSRGRTLISSQTASASATIDFTSVTNSSLFSTYEIELIDVLPATDNVDFYLRVSEDNGVSWEADASDYAYARTEQLSNTTNNDANSTGATHVNMISAIGNASDEGLNGIIRVPNLASTSKKKRFSFDLSGTTAAGNFKHVIGGAMYLDTVVAITGLRLLFSSGNIASGTLRLWGLP